MEGMRLDLTIKGPQKNKTKITKEAFILKCLFFLQYILLIKIFFCDNIFDINFIQGVYLMYISNSKDIKKYFSNLRITNKINRKLNSLFSNIIFDNESELLSLSNNFSKNHNISKQEAIIKIFIDCILKSNENSTTIPIEIIEKIIEKGMILENFDNKYLNSIEIEDMVGQNVDINKHTNKTYKTFKYLYSNWESTAYIDNNSEKINDFLIPNFVINKKLLEIPCFVGNKYNTAITPNKILMCEQYIGKCYGKVVVFGCDMGYVPFMLSNNTKVNKILIIEDDVEMKL